MLYEVITGGGNDMRVRPNVPTHSYDMDGYDYMITDGSLYINFHPSPLLILPTRLSSFMLRITSYNVCYTKLLRLAGLLSQALQRRQQEQSRNNFV